MRDKILTLFPEIEWIKDKNLREKVLSAWIYAFEQSSLTPEDLETIPFTLLIEKCPVSFINHKRTCVQLAVDIANRMQTNFSDDISIDMDVLTAGALLIDVGKLLEYENVGGQLGISKSGDLVRHPFSGVAIADRCGLPPEVQHIIATHSREGDLGHRSVEALIVHHADFVSYEPFKAQV